MTLLSLTQRFGKQVMQVAIEIVAGERDPPSPPAIFLIDSNSVNDLSFSLFRKSFRELFVFPCSIFIVFPN